MTLFQARLSVSRTQFTLVPLILLVALLWASCSIVSPPRSSNHDVVLSFEGLLFDQEEKLAVMTFRFELPAVEWMDSEGRWKLETFVGGGEAKILKADSGFESVPIQVRVKRYQTGAPLSLGDDGSRLWSFRGDLYLQAQGHPLVEIELGGDIRFPAPGSQPIFPTGIPPPALEQNHSSIVAMMVRLQQSELGGGLIYGRTTPIFGRAASKLPGMGFIQLASIKMNPARKDQRERDADRLMSRLLYVSADYPLAVRDGAVIDEGEYWEQVNLLQEASLLAENLAIAAPIRLQLSQVRQFVDWKSPPSEVSGAIRQLTQDLVRSLWLTISSPEPSPLSEARDLYAELCAVCHGNQGDAKTPKASELNPPPPAFSDPAFLASLSPYRAFNSIMWGIPGTGMPSFESLSDRDRWGLAFFIFSFHHEKQTPDSKEGSSRSRMSLPLEELALKTDDELSGLLKKKLSPGEVAAALAFLRTTGVEQAALSPLEEIRKSIRQAARSHSKEPLASLAQAGEAKKRFAIALPPEAGNTALAIQVRHSLEELQALLQRKSDRKEIEAKAYSVIEALNRMEESFPSP